MHLQDRLDSALQYRAGVFTRARQDALADDFGLQVRLAQGHVQTLLDVLGLAFLDDQYRLLAGAEANDFLIEQRIGDVEHVERQLGRAEGIRESRELERAQQRVVETSLEDDADVTARAAQKLVQAMLADVGERGRPALLDFLLFVEEARRRQDDARYVANGTGEGVPYGECRRAIALGGEAAVDVARTDSQFQHDRRIRRLGQLEAALDHLDGALQVARMGLGAEPEIVGIHLRQLAQFLLRQAWFVD